MGEWSAGNLPDLTGRVAIVTGANTGLGLATTRALAAAGARVLMACRNQDKAESARRQVLAVTGAGEDQVQVGVLDLADQAGVARFAEGVLGGHDRLDLLINNAGLGFVDQARTVDGYELHFGVNHLGHMALTLRLLPLLVATTTARVVPVSSVGHRAGRMRMSDPNFADGGYTRTRAYTQSKVANLLFATELGRRLAAAGHDTLSVAASPAGGRTELGTKQNSGVMRPLSKLAKLMPSLSPEEGAHPILRAATDPRARSGEMYEPAWGRRGEPVVRTPGVSARDPQLAAELWTLSLRLLTMEEPTQLAPAGTRPR